MASELETKHRHVLVVDDSDDDVLLLCKAVRQSRVPWIVAAVLCDGEQAIRYLEKCIKNPARSRIPDLMLLDLKMPRQSGFEVLGWLQENLGDRLKAVVLSSSPEPSDMRRADELGAARYVVKPCSLKGLVAMLMELDGLIERGVL